MGNTTFQRSHFQKAPIINNVSLSYSSNTTVKHLNTDCEQLFISFKTIISL